MKIFKRVMSVLMAAATAAYLMLAPKYFVGALKKDPYREWLEPEREAYSGVLTVWHIAGFKPYTGSIGSWLCRWTERLEKRHKGVFFETIAMTPEEAAARAARGEKADIYSFPAGWAYEEQLRPLSVEVPQYPAGLRDIGRSGGVLALPYALSGYCVLVNASLAEERGLSLPEAGATADWLCEAGEKMNFERKNVKIAAFAGDTVTAARLGIEQPVAAYDEFLAGRAAVAFTDLRGAGELKRSVEAGKNFDFIARPIDSCTDEVQMIAVAKGIREEKIPYAEELIALILGEKQQSTLAELGMFPAILYGEPLQYDGELLSSCFALYREPLAPNAFLYRRQKDALMELAERSLAGDDSARQDFAARWKELVPQEKIK